MAADLQAHQDEIVNAISAAGITPSGADLTQLTKAIYRIAIPVGTIYTQLPGKSAPATLYPGTTWSNISSAFAGAFFRAEGGKAVAFAGGKQDDAFQGHKMGRASDGHALVMSNSMGAGSANTTRTNVTGDEEIVIVTDGVNGTPRTADETRPTNYTVRVWERTE